VVIFKDKSMKNYINEKVSRALDQYMVIDAGLKNNDLRSFSVLSSLPYGSS